MPRSETGPAPKIRTWFRRATKSVDDVADGFEPAETPPPGARSSIGDTDRETSTNALTSDAGPTQRLSQTPDAVPKRQRLVRASVVQR
jgi:hypothetical protein